MIEPRKACRVDQFAKDHDLSRAQAYAEIPEGRLIARKVGTRTLITEEDATAWRHSLPRMQSAEQPAA
jgi:hypothetical protein